MREIANEIVETINETKNDYDASEQAEKILKKYFGNKPLIKSTPKP
jgi:ABC-type amino acid transport substrate-binding protein